jgi:hypothetical protein
MPSKNPEFHIWFQPAYGAALAVRSTDFESLEAAVTAVNDALQRGRVLRFERNGGVDGSGVALVNFAQVVAVRVRPEPVPGAEDGQYL